MMASAGDDDDVAEDAEELLAGLLARAAEPPAPATASKKKKSREQGAGEGEGDAARAALRVTVALLRIVAELPHGYVGENGATGFPGFV
jgi:hypothetical protein